MKPIGSGTRPAEGRTATHRMTRLCMAALPAVFMLAGCKKPAPQTLPPPVVGILEIKETEISMTASIIGQLDSPQNVEIRARVEAFVEKVCFTEGSNVKQGDLLFALDKKPFVERLSASKADQAKADAGLKKAEADLARIRPLAGTGAVSKQDLDNATAAVDAAKASLDAAKAKVESSQIDLGYCDVRSPINGLIGAKEVSVGDLVGKGQATLLATMSSLDPIWCYCNIAEVDFIKIKNRALELGLDVGKLPLTLVLPNGQDHPKRGKLVFFDRAVSTKTGTMRVRAEFPNPTEILRPGMFVRVRFEGGTRPGIQIPERAVMEIQGKAFVWVVDEKRVATQRPITLGDQKDSQLVVLGGLKPGERIVVEGINKVREGSPVMTPADLAAHVAAGKQPAKP